LAAVGNHRLAGLVPLAAIFAGSRAVGNTFARWRGDGGLKRDATGGLISIGNAKS
jgi:hypothetical protein